MFYRANSSPTNSRAKRGALLLATALAGAATFAAPSEARAGFTVATVAEWGLSGMVSTLAGQGVKYAFFNDNGLSSSDISAIKTVIDTELTAQFTGQTITTVKADADTVIDLATSYLRGTTAGDLTTAMTNAQRIVENATNVMDEITAQSASTQYALAATYSTMSTIRVAFEKELWESCVAQNGITPDTCSPGQYSTNVSKFAQSALTQLKTYKSEFDGQFSGTSVSKTSSSNKDFDYCASDGKTAHKDAKTWHANYCFKYTPYGGSAKTLCPTSDLSASSNAGGPYTFLMYQCTSYYSTDRDLHTVSSTDQTKSQTNGSIFLQQMKMKYRDEQLGGLFYETMAALQKTASGDIGYCGDGVCSINETRFRSGTTTPVCADDCTYVGTSGTSSTAAKGYAVLPFGTVTTPAGTGVATGTGATYTTPTETRLLTLNGADLKWQTDGNLVLYSSNGSVLWTSATYNNATTLNLQTSGSMSISNAGKVVWTTDTSPDSVTSTTLRPVYLVLLSDVLYLVDGYWNVWWESDTDFHVYGSLGASTASPRFCQSVGTKTTLASHSYHDLVWDTDGNLKIITVAKNTVWSTGVSGGAYLCNQEDGSVVIYNSSYKQLWSSGTGGGSVKYNFNGWGGDLQLIGSQALLTAPSGDPIWSNGLCTGSGSYACTYPATPTAKYSVPSSEKCWSSGSTLLSNDYADLKFDSSGTLLISDKTGATATTIWKQSPSYPSTTTSKQVCLTTSGDLQIKATSTTSTTAVWKSSTSASGGMLALAGCNMAVQGSNTAALYTTQTACSYGAYKSTSWLAN